MFDIIEFCVNFNIPYATSGKNIGAGWVGLDCPYHSDEGKHLGFNLAGNYFYCWKCGGHSLKKIIKDILSCSWNEAESVIDQYNGRYNILGTMNKKVPIAQSLELPGESPLPPLYRKYLKKRGLDPDYIEQKYRVTAGGIVGDFKYRLIIPIYENNVLVSYQGRDVSGLSPQRYKTLSVEKSVVNPKNCLFNLDNARGSSIMVCEGPFDVFKLGDGAVATLGTSTTETQVRKLAVYKTVYIIFDPEEEAQQRAKKLAERVASLGSIVYIIDMGGYKDPGDLSAEEVVTLRKELGFC